MIGIGAILTFMGYIRLCIWIAGEMFMVPFYGIPIGICFCYLIGSGISDAVESRRIR